MSTSRPPVPAIPDRGAPPPRLERVAPGVLAWVQPDGSWMLNNCGAIEHDGRVLLVDTTSTEVRTLAFLAAVDEATDGAGRHLLVNTHHHADHTFGNHLAGVPVAGSAALREEVLRSGLVAQQLFEADWGDVRVNPPDVVFAGRLDLWVGDLAVEAHVMGPGHTAGDVAVWVPERRVLFSGDLVFHGGHPFLVEGSLRRYPAVLERLREFGADVLVPGHGEPLTGADVDRELRRHLDYAAWLAAVAADAHAAGRPLAEAAQVAAADPGYAAFAGLGESERVVGNLARAYAELDGAPDASPLDLREIAPLMTARAGGALRCLA